MPGLALPWWRQLRWGLALFFVVLVVIPIVVVVTLAFTQARGTAEQQALDQLESVAELKTQVIDHWLDDSAAALSILLSGEPRRNQFNAVVEAGDRSSGAAQDALTFILRDAAQDYRDIEEFFFYDAADGRVLLSSERDRVGQLVSAEPYFEPSMTGPYLQAPYYDDSGQPVIVVTRPVVNREARVIGVLAARLDPDALARIMEERAGLGDTGETYLVSAANRALLAGSRLAADEQPDAYHSAGIDAALAGTDGSGAYADYRGAEVFGVYRWLPQLQAALVAEIDQSEALAGYNAAQRLVLVLTVVLALAAAGAGVWVATRFTRPMNALAATALRFAGGDLSVRASDMPRNEIGQLANVFNSLAGQVQELVEALESRVQERTRDLFLTLEVGQMASRIHRLDDLLPRITDYIREQFDLYYTQVYLNDDAGRYAVLRSGTGAVGRQLLERGHRLDLRETSIVARAVQSKRPVLVSDTEVSDIFKANPLLPETRSEIAIPLIVGDEVIGVLDMQAHEAGTFHADNLAVFEAMANQLAAAINSAQAHAEMEAAIGRATAINRRLTAEAWEGYLARIGRDGRIGYAYDLQQVEPLDGASDGEDSPRSGNGHGHELKRPVSIGGQAIGRIALAEDGARAWSDEDRALVDDVAHQLAQALEQFRAFDDTQTSQRLLRTIIDTSPDWIFAKDTAYRYLLVNRSFAEFYGGLTPEEMQGMDDYELGTPVELIEGAPEQGIVGFRVDDRKVIEHGETVFNPNDVVQFADGSRHIFETTKLPLRNAQGEIIGVLGVARDVTEVREAEAERARLLADTEDQARRLALLNRMATEISAAESIDAVYSIVARYAARVLHSERASVALLNDDGTQFEFLGLDGVEGAIPAGTILPVAGTHIGTVLEAGELQVVPDLRELDAPEVRQLAEQGLAASMSVPLVVGEKAIGVLSVATTGADAYDSRDQGVLVQIGSLLASNIENYRLLAETQRRAVEMETVALVGAEASSTLEVENLLWSVVELTKEQFGLYHAHIYLVDQSGQHLVLRAGAGEAGRRMVDAGHRIAVGHGASLVARAARTRETVIVNDVTASPDFLPNPLLPLTRSEMAVAMVVGDQLVGVLDVQSDRLQGFTEIDRQVYSALAAQIAVAVNNARLFAETQRRAVEMETVAQVSAEASTTLDPEQLLWDVSELVKQRFELYHAHVYLLDPEQNRLQLSAGAGDAGRMMVAHGHAIPVDRAMSVVARAARTREAVIENDVAQAEEFLANPLLPETRAELAVPMIVGDTLIGVLDVQADRRGYFTETDRQIYSTLAAQIAVAVNNARLFAEQVAVAEQLRDVDRLKSEFLASMSHELRTPLNSIIGYAEVLLDGIDGELSVDMEEDVSAIHGSGKHLLNLINDILDLAKIEAGQMDLVTEPLALRPLVEDMANTSRVLFKNKPVELVIDVPDDLPPVTADPLRVRQVISNLLSNASKFTDEGSITIWAEPYDRDPAMIHVGVTDTGIGMSAGQAAVIFDRFRQVDQSHTRRAGGTGLGLSITRQLIELHNGDIWVESEPGAGSTFHFTLPVATGTGAEA